MFITTLLLLAIFGARVHEGIETKHIEYSSEGVTLKGYLAYDAHATDKRPGILVVHEWWGQNEYARKRAEMLAELGYVALAVDMYGEGKLADHPNDAGKFATEVMKNMPMMRARFLAALDALWKNSLVDPDRIAAIGYCFGGGVVLNMARAGTDLRGVVSFHGSLSTGTPAEKGKVKASVLVCNGAADQMISAGDLEKFEEEMAAAGAKYKVVSYEGAMHSFTNPGSTEMGKKFDIPIAYDAAADKKSWEDMKEFLNEVLKK